MSAFVELFGSKLLKGENQVSTAEALSGKKAVAVYFSAHWCPPCRGFTPKLAEWYKKDLQSKGLEVVFASSDRDESSFKSYYNEQPWLALPYSEREIKNTLSKKYKVQGIPSLVILDCDGNTITQDGRGAVSSDPTGENFPWIPKSFDEIIKDMEVVNNDKKTMKLSEFNDLEAIGFYFSAHWCPPCKGFTPELAKTYKSINADKKRFEIVFLSCDRDQASFDSYFKEMPWTALNFDNKKLNDELSSHFDCNGIPHLVIVDAKTKQVINKSAVGKVRGDSQGLNFPWAPEAVKEIDEDPEGIDEDLSLILLQESASEDEKKKYKSVMNEIAKEIKKIDNDKREVAYFCASTSGRLADRVRSECGLKTPDTSDGDGEVKQKENVVAVMMDIGSEKYYEFTYKEFTVENVKKFFDAFSQNKVESKIMGSAQ